MSSNRLINIFFISLILAGCDFQKINEQRDEIYQLQIENKELASEVKNQSSVIRKNDKQLSICLGELADHKSGVAEKHSWWVNTWLIVALFLGLGVLVTLAINYYLMSIKGPKIDEINDHEDRIRSEKSIVEKIRNEAEQLNASVDSSRKIGAILQSEIYELKSDKEKLANELEELHRIHKNALAKIAEADDDLKLLNAFIVKK